MTQLTTFAWRATIVVTIFNAVSALGGAVAMLPTNGLGMPSAMLVNSPFTSFLPPAVILFGVVGGTQALAAIQQLRRRPSSLVWTAFAGFTMVIWILVETIMIQGFGLLQALYFVTGLAQIVLTLGLLGIVPWLPRIDLGERNG